ncbi:MULTISPECIES: ABC transporter ATP-binding protein [unclassified Achromobacter]|uniref:ABC transporter ATP-binding protein n=1 Tax=unclassified Achromobacter TaxID=2626865 RepID=UPI000B51ABE5|nr:MULTISPECIES: ABC transporter ATP-binding protein [unclassified Achromobacter]OWT75521.1 ABC transporter ATP-binding protein [Achromobacter sp. HZ28]OWT76181.1 ABC transporter ATP-binding protein [Achromobacter sp. HZ34]
MSAMLEVRELSRNFGGLKAVSELTFDVGRDEVVGLIGPNGAGKSTAFNLISGTLRPSAGQVHLHGRDITGLAPSRVVRHGLARTFQSTAVYPTATVAENIQRGALSTLPGSIWTQILPTGTRRQALAAAANEVEEVLELTGLGPYRDVVAGGLSYGHQKKLGVAVGIATRPDLLLMDEPAAGLNGEECAEFGRLLKQLQRERKLSILLVEHHMALVMDLCQRIVVLVHGRKIADDTPANIRANPAVIEAYLGAPDYAHA